MEITKEEFLALIDVQTKATEQMITIATSLHAITEEQKEILHCLKNGMKKEIVDMMKQECFHCTSKINDGINILHETLSDRGIVIKRIDDNINFTKWFVGIVGCIVIAASVILRGLESHQLRNIGLDSNVKHQMLLDLKNSINTESQSRGK